VRLFVSFLVYQVHAQASLDDEKQLVTNLSRLEQLLFFLCIYNRKPRHDKLGLLCVEAYEFGDMVEQGLHSANIGGVFETIRQ